MSVFPLDTLPLPVLQVIQDYLAIGYKLTSCLGPEPPKPESQPCKGMLYIASSSLPRVEIPKLEARQTPPGQPTVTDLLELHDVICVCDWPKGFYGLVVEITEQKRKDLEFFDIGYVSTGADFIPNSRPNRRGEYRNKQLLRKIVAVDGQLRFVYPPAFAKEPTIEIVARRVRNRQLKLF